MARSFTNTTENDVLNSLFGTPSYTAHPSNLVLRLSTTFATDAGVITEPAGGYVEQAITFGAASSGVVSNNAAITFPVATSPWGTIVAWAVRDTVAGVTLATGYMGTLFDALWDADPSNDTIIGFLGVAPANGTRIFLSEVNADGTLSGFLDGYSFAESAAVPYYVINADSPSTGKFQLSLTSGGAAVTFTVPHSGSLQIWTSKFRSVVAGDQLEFPIGSISIRLK